MKKLLILPFVFALCILNMNAQTAKYEVVFNPNTCLYEAHMHVITSYTDPDDQFLGPSGFSIVIPASFANSPIATTAVNPSTATWSDNTPIYAPPIAPGSDFHKFATFGDPFNFGTSLAAGADIILFTFSLPSTNCTSGIRMFINWGWIPVQTNPDPTSAQMPGGADFRNSYQPLLTGESYIGNFTGATTTLPAFTANMVQSCVASDMLLTASTTGLSSCMSTGMTYTWKKDGSLLATTLVPTYTVNSFTAGVYEVTETNAFGCTASKSLSITSGCSILPVELLNFNAVKQGNHSYVSWATSQETNNHHFDVEHSIDGINFTKIGEVAGAGNSNSLLQYSFIHQNPVSGNNYYRLRQVDYDGRFKHSLVKVVKFEYKAVVAVLPNPTSDKVFITTSDGGVMKSVTLFTVDGRQLEQYIDFASGKSIDLSKYAAGTYVFRIIDSKEQTEMKKIVKQQ